MDGCGRFAGPMNLGCRSCSFWQHLKPRTLFDLSRFHVTSWKFSKLVDALLLLSCRTKEFWVSPILHKATLFLQEVAPLAVDALVVFLWLYSRLRPLLWGAWSIAPRSRRAKRNTSLPAAKNPRSRAHTLAWVPGREEEHSVSVNSPKSSAPSCRVEGAPWRGCATFLERVKANCILAGSSGWLVHSSGLRCDPRHMEASLTRGAVYHGVCLQLSLSFFSFTETLTSVADFFVAVSCHNSDQRYLDSLRHTAYNKELSCFFIPCPCWGLSKQHQQWLQAVSDRSACALIAMEGSTLFSEENSKHVKKFFSDLISTVTACKDDGEDPLEPDSPGGPE